MANNPYNTAGYEVLKGKSTQNELEQARVTLKNMLIRKQTKWSVTEVKLFYSALSQIKKRDEKSWVKLNKKDVIELLNMNKEYASNLRNLFISVMKKSFVQFDGETEEEWHDGFLIAEIRSTKKEIYVRFMDTYLPLLDDLSDNFTTFFLDNIAKMKSKHAINLFTYLKSTYYPIRPEQRVQISLEELKKIFELDETDYVRTDAKRKGWFDVTNFRKRVLEPAIVEINENFSGMRIEPNIKPIRRGGIVGYELFYCLLNRDGSIRDDYDCYSKSPHELEFFK